MTADEIKALVEQLGHRLYGPGECALSDIALISQSETAIATLTLETQRLRVDAHALRQELRNIANADTKEWDDPTQFEAWAKSRARHTLDAIEPPSKV